jgi:hypothetical protein
MTSKMHRMHIPNVGETMAIIGSGMPFEAMDALPGSMHVGDAIRLGRKTFVLGRLGATITNTELGLKNSLPQSVSQAVLPAAVAAGAMTMSITVGASDGAASDGAVAANEMINGEVVIFKSGANTPFCRGITGNTAVAAGGGTMVITLDSPVPFALTVSDAAEAMHSEWYSLKQDNQIGNPVVGVATIAGTSGQYIWVQTWGKCFVSPQSGVGVTGQIGAWWRHDGSIDVYANIGTYVSTQYAGFVTCENSSHAQGAPFLMLQIMP